MTKVFNDLEFVHSFLDASAALVERSYKLLAATLDELRIPHSDCKSAVFVWVDMRHLLSKPTWDAELELMT